MNVLVVEDDLAIAEMVEEDLLAVNINCRLALSLEQAEHALATDKFTCVVLDRGLPRRTGGFSERRAGDELLRWMCRSGIQTPVIIHSGSASGVDELLRTGAQAYVPKPSPVGENSLVATIQRIAQEPPHA